MKNRALNVFKGLACILVVFIHITFPGVCGDAVSRIAAVSVPFFFMVSGFFSFESSGETLLRRAKKIFYIFVVSAVIYLLYGLVTNLNEINVWASNIFGIKNIVKFFALNRCLFASHLWFLPALVYVYIIAIIVKRFNLRKLMYFCIPILFIGRMAALYIIEKYSPTAFNYADNFALTGLPYFYLGMFLHERTDFFIYRAKKWLVVSFVTFEIVNVFLSIVFNVIVAQPFVALAAGSIFCFGVLNPEMKCKTLEFVGDKLSLYVYVIHVLVLWIYRLFFDTSNSVVSWIFPLIVAVSSLLISLLIYKCKVYMGKRRTVK